MSKEEILSQIYDMFEDGVSVEEVAKYFENLQSQLDIANKKLDKIKDINRFSYTINFMLEFIEYTKRSEITNEDDIKNKFDFEDFMKTMYGSIEEFKKYNLKDMEEDFKSICNYLEKYEKISKLVEEVSNE